MNHDVDFGGSKDDVQPAEERRTWRVDDVGSQEFGPLLLVALLRDVTCKQQEKRLEPKVKQRPLDSTTTGTQCNIKPSVSVSDHTEQCEMIHTQSLTLSTWQLNC